MLASTTFKLRIEPETKKILFLLASREGRSQSNLLKRLILEKYEATKATEKTNQPQHGIQTAN